MISSQRSELVDTTSTCHPRVDFHHEDENVVEDVLEDLAIYRLDFEDSLRNQGEAIIKQESVVENSPQVTAAGGEVLKPGDHVYLWCTMYQHHGIVLETRMACDTTTSIRDSNATRAGSVVIAEFTNLAMVEESDVGSWMASVSVGSQATSGGGVAGGFRIVLENDPSRWHTVKYRAHPILECLTWRPGTCTSATPSAVPTILTRVAFLRNCRHRIPDYHVLACNCETVAVWCRTGKWETLQGDRALQLSELGCAVVAFSTAPVPALPLLSMAAGGLALWHSRQIASLWEATAERLNREFEWYSMGKTPEVIFQQTS
jgi:hypothetical protein